MRATLSAWAKGVLTGAALATGAAVAADYPSKPIRLISPWPAGGPTDAFLRPLAEVASKRLGQPIVVENKPGASASLGLDALARAKPDGYTLGQFPITAFTMPHLSTTPWHPLQDFTYILRLTGYTFGIVVRADAPWKTLEAFIAHARAHPGEVTYGISGVGSTGHLAMEEIGETRGVRFVTVPFKGGAVALPALLGGHVDAIAVSSVWAAHVDAGKLRLLATLGEERSKRWPAVPTLKELGFGIVSTSPYGIAGPKGMDAAVVRKLHDAFKAALRDATILKAMERLDQIEMYLGPAEYAQFARREFAEQGELIKRLGLAKTE